MIADLGGVVAQHACLVAAVGGVQAVGGRVGAKRSGRGAFDRGGLALMLRRFIGHVALPSLPRGPRPVRARRLDAPCRRRVDRRWRAPDRSWRLPCRSPRTPGRRRMRPGRSQSGSGRHPERSGPPPEPSGARPRPPRHGPLRWSSELVEVGSHCLPPAQGRPRRDSARAASIDEGSPDVMPLASERRRPSERGEWRVCDVVQATDRLDRSGDRRTVWAKRSTPGQRPEVRSSRARS